MSRTEFSIPIQLGGATLECLAYHSKARRNTFIVASGNTDGIKPTMSVFNVRDRFARHVLRRFMQLRLTALYDGEVDGSEVHAVEAVVLWRGVEKFKAIYSINDSTSEILFNRWGK